MKYGAIKNRKKAGFTLLETLLAVAIIAIVSAVAFIGVTSIQRDLRQTELDGKAQIIYMAAQNRFSELRAAGRNELLLDETYAVPLSAGGGKENAADLYCISSKTAISDPDAISLADAILPDGFVDSELQDGYWYIEYNPTSASVASVFYSAKPFDYNNASAALRTRSARKAAGATVGYYSGDVVDIDTHDKLKPEIEVINGEKLIVNITCQKQAGTTVDFDITFRDANGNEIKIATTAGTFIENGYSFVLDDLTNQKTRFYKKYQSLTPGELTITVTASSANSGISSGTVSAKTNTLFADKSTGDTAYIACGRHLQNLDEDSGVTKTVTKVIQEQSIYFKGEDSKWVEAYGDRNFDAINNKNLLTYDGGSKGNTRFIIEGLTVSEIGGNAGLFGTFSGKEIKGVTLVDARASGTNAGALAGTINGGVKIDDCRVYLRDVAAGENIDYRISGTKSAGGLVGNAASMEITSSFAATTVESTANMSGVGGLVGIGDAKIKNSYADCYLNGYFAGGLVGYGQGNTTVNNSYAAGFARATYCSTGFAYGISTASNSYSAVKHEGDGDKIAIAAAGTCNNVNYLDDDLDEYTDNASPKTAETLCDDLIGFGTSGRTNAYNLRPGMGLSDYPFAFIKTGNTVMPHYGDWQASFTEGLVYFEEYADGSFGFFGGSINALQNRLVVADGYALAYKSDLGSNVTASYNGNTITSAGLAPAQYKDTTYYLRTFDNSSFNSANTKNEFYQTLKAANVDYYFNPMFASTVRTGEPSDWETDHTVIIRSARQLSKLPGAYGSYSQTYSKTISGWLFSQETDIDYAAYTGEKVSNIQRPIGSAETRFTSTYDGGGFYISGVSFNADKDSSYAGMFAYNSGVLKNIALANRFDGAEATQKAWFSIGDKYLTTEVGGANKKVYLGALAGFNSGTITNCAASGYIASTDSGLGTTTYMGGLVGFNQGTIRRSSANSPSLSALGYMANVYVGGFAGYNSGYITGSYALGYIYAKDYNNNGTASTGYALIAAGFSAANGSCDSCYSAVAFKTEGPVTPYAFAPKPGSAANCKYLYAGSYFYNGTLYNYPEDVNSAGTPTSSAELQGAYATNSSFGKAAADSAYTSPKYPYPTSVKNSANQFAHYGVWPEAADLGLYGIFYWEREEVNGNARYSMSSLSEAGKTNSTLCTSHNDGGVITEYGYGYYYKDGQQVLFTNSTNLQLGDKQQNPAEEFSKQFGGYNFVAYKTGTNGLHITDNSANAMVKVGSTSFEISPFFASAMSLSGTAHPAPGSEKNPYQIRSIEQLQYINWNSNTKNVSTTITSKSAASNSKFTYLVYASGTNVQTGSWNYYWDQTHDVNAQNQKFYPIGSLFDADTEMTKYSDVCTAYFAGVYSGGDYIIKNVNISSGNQCVGLFGITAGAKLENIVLYSDDEDNAITEDGGQRWYCIGGLVGFAGKGTSSTANQAVISNCSVSGYEIVDNRGTDGSGGWGGAYIGGLVGATNMDITGCTAVTDITVNYKYNSKDINIRVGGIAGSSRGTVSDCYAGGQIVSTVATRDTSANFQNTSIWVGGIVGGIYIRSAGNLGTLIGSVTGQARVENCYSYVLLPQSEKISKDSHQVRSVQSIASNGELQYTNFGAADPSHVEINNCYCLAANAQGAEDYQNNKDSSVWYRINTNSSSWDTGRGIYITNTQGTPYLTYDQMADSANLLAKLGTAFSTVTTSPGAEGKYSFSGGDPELEMKDYPFPTVLTQTDARDGVVNVHYGAWPKVGLFVSQSSVSLDLLSDKKDGSAVNDEIELKFETITATQPEISGVNEEIAKVSLEKVDGKADTYRVIVTGVSEGTTQAVFTSGAYSCTLNINVTAVINVAAPPPLTIEVGGPKSAEVSATDAKGNPLQVSWKFTADAESGTRVEFSPYNSPADMAKMSLNVKGIAPGDATITAEAGVKIGDKTYTKTAQIIVSVTRPGVIGLASTGIEKPVYNEVLLKNVTTSSGTDNEEYTTDAPQLAGSSLFIYYASADEPLGNWTVNRISVDGTLLQNGEIGEKYCVTVGDTVISDGNGYSYLPVTVVSSKTNEEISLTISLVNGTRTVNLTVPYKTADKEPEFTVTFDANGGMGTAEPQTLGYGDTVDLNAVGFTRDGYKLTGWNTKADGSGKAYSVDDKVKVAADMTLYAQWTVNTRTISFNANGGTGAMKEQSAEYGAEIRLTYCAFQKSGYAFSGWNTAADGSGESYDDGGQITVTSDVTLYAQWARVYTVTFKAGNHGIGSDYTQEFVEGIGDILLENRFTGKGIIWKYQFVNWNTKQNGNGITYYPNTPYFLKEDIVLYAQWTR